MLCSDCNRETRGNRKKCDRCYSSDYRQKYPERRREQERRFGKKVRLDIIKMLGSECVKCGFTDIRALQVDKISGGHQKDIKEIYNGNTHAFYSFYRKNPEMAFKELQVLCANCNWIKRYENNEIKRKNGEGIFV